MDLTAAEVEVKEDGKTRAVLKVEPMSEPLSVALLLDDRGSDINEIRASLAAFVSRVQGRAEVSLVSVVPTTLKIFDYTSSTPAMMSGIQRLVWRAGPAGGLVLSAVADAADDLKRREVARPGDRGRHVRGRGVPQPQASQYQSLPPSSAAAPRCTSSPWANRRCGR